MAAFVQCLCSTFIARLLLKTSLTCTAVRSIEEEKKEEDQFEESKSFWLSGGGLLIASACMEFSFADDDGTNTHSAEHRKCRNGWMKEWEYSAGCSLFRHSLFWFASGFSASLAEITITQCNQYLSIFRTLAVCRDRQKTGRINRGRFFLFFFLGPSVSVWNQLERHSDTGPPTWGITFFPFLFGI